MQAQPMNRDVQEMQDKALTGLKEARGVIESYACENPRTTIALAVGVGFVLGGGLTPRILLGFGALAARTYVRGQLGTYATELLGERPQA